MSNIERTDTNVGNIKKDIENVRSFLFKLEDETELKLVEKENYDKLVKRIKELEEENKKYIVQLTDEQYRNLVDTIRKKVKQEFEQKVKDGIEELKLSGGSNGKDDIENLARKLIIDVLEELLED